MMVNSRNFPGYFPGSPNPGSNLVDHPACGFCPANTEETLGYSRQCETRPGSSSRAQVVVAMARTALACFGPPSHWVSF